MHSLVGKRIRYHLEGSEAVQEANVTGQITEATILIEQRPVHVSALHVHEVLGESTAPVSHAAPAAEPHTAPAPEPDADHDARRLSTPRVSGETRRKHGRKGAPDHGSAAAQPDEYEKPAAE